MALKRIRLQGKQKETVDGFIDEIKLLKRLRGKDNIVQIVDAEVCPNEGLILVVLEFGEIDLAKMLNKRELTRGEAPRATRRRQFHASLFRANGRSGENYPRSSNRALGFETC